MAGSPSLYLHDYGQLQVPLCILQLDPADRAVLRIADERDAVQKKTFTKWLNKHLMKVGRRVVELFEDLKDGHNLISLLEVLAHDLLPREKGHMRFHKIQNVQIALQFLKHKGIKLVNIRADEIVDGNPKLTLGLIWTIILHFQVSDVVVPGQEDISARDALLLWSRRTCEGYPGVKVKDFSKSWRDGKAFLSIIHRNRPDLVDFRKVRGNTNRQNLDTAFGTAERELGVTKLLDPEDVDVPNPDEKSIITYVSSLYDVFPDVPSMEQTLRDNERQLKTDEYHDLTTSLLLWLQEATAVMMDRSFPSTLTQVKALFAEFNRFRVEDVPPRLEQRHKLLRLFEDIQAMNINTSYLGIEEDIFPEAINRHWNRFTIAQQERETALQAELVRLERLQRLAEKIHREAKHAEDSLDDIDRRILEEQKRVDVVHPFEAKRNCDALDRALKNIEDTVRSLFRDIQALQDGRYATADQLYGRVSNLQSRISQLRTKLFSDVIQRLLTKSHVEEQITTTRERQVLTKVRLVETNPAFRHIQDCLKWIESKQGALDETDCGHDQPTVEAKLQQHRQEHQEIHNFRTEVDKCIADRINLHPEDQTLYTEWLSKLEVAFSVLTNSSSRRLKCLESLIEFVQAATQELIWLNEREEVELSRDWSSRDLNLPQTEEFFQNLMHELQIREGQFNSVQERGEAMVLDRHPAAASIEAYMKAMQSQWSWLLQLTACLESHVKQATAFFQFFDDARTCDQWLSQQEDLLHHRYSREGLAIEEMEQFLRELQTLEQQINAKEREISSLVVTSQDIVPLRQRSIAVMSPVKVVCLCSYRQPTMTLQKGDNCILMNSSQRIKWKVKNSSGQEELVPSVCFMIPPPNPEAIEQAERLRKRLDHLQVVWRSCQRRIRHNMVLSTITIIKGWDLKQFMSLEPAKREAFWRAVNEDAEKLITEVGENDREMRKLRDELEKCNKIFLNLSTAAVEEEARKARTPDQDFMRQAEMLSKHLNLCDQALTARLHEPLPRDKPNTEKALRQQKEWEKMVRQHEGELEQTKHSFATISLKTPQMESKLNLLTHKWEQMWAISHIYIERLKTIDLIVPGLHSIKRFVTDTETRLSTYNNMTSDKSSLIRIKKELEGMKTSIVQQQPSLKNLKSATADLRNHVQKSRPSVEEHPDLESLEEEITDLSTRWENITTQLDERLRDLDSALELLTMYKGGLQNEESWVAETQQKVASQPPVTSDADYAKQLLQPTVTIYNSLAERQHQIEAVNRHGGQFIREAKTYDIKLRQYRTTLDHGASSMVDGVSKRVKIQDGAETVKVEMETLNKNYMEMVKWAHSRLKQIVSVLSASGIDVQMYIQQEIPLLRTFRAELAKRSSMLVDEDMQEFFQQLSDFEGYGSMPAEFYGASTNKSFISQATLKPFQSTTETPAIQRTLQVSKLGSVSDEVDAPHKSVTTVTLELSPSPRMMPPSSVSPENLSQKIANITNISVFCQGNKTAYPLETFHQPEHAQTLITVKQGQVAPRGSVVHVSAILNTKTGRKVNLVEAVKSGLIDVRSMSIIDPDSKRKISMSEASRRGMITSELQHKLGTACGIQDPTTKKNCSLSEALQKELFDPVHASVMDPTLGKHIPIHEAVKRRIISSDTARTLCGEGATITIITQTQAVFGDLELSSMETALGLAEIIDKGLYVKSTGQIKDPLSRKQMTLLSAVEKGIINPLKKEVRDSNNYISLTDAVTRGIIDPIAGCYHHSPTGRKIPLDEAYQSWELNKPMTLPVAMRMGLLSESGQFIDPNSGKVRSFQDALSSGLLDGDTKCIVDPQTNNVTSVNESIKSGLIDIRNAHIPTPSGDSEPLLMALVQGHIKLVDVDITFPTKCIKDTQTGETVTVAEAMRKGIITSNGDFVDTQSGRRILLRAAASQGLVNKGIADSLMRDSSMKDSSGKNLSIMKAIQLGLFDPERGDLRDPITKEVIPIQVATLKGVISTEDAQSLLELLGSAATHTSIITKLQPGQQGEYRRTVSVSEATAQGLLIERNGTFCDPNTGSVMPVEEAIEKGLLHLSSEWPSGSAAMLGLGMMDMEKPDSNQVKKSEHGYSFTQKTISHPAVSQTVIQETRHLVVQKVVDPRTKQVVDVQEAINRGLLDVAHGLFIHPMTGEKLPMKMAIDQGFVVGTEASDDQLSDLTKGTSIKQTKSFSITGVIHPRTGQKLTASQATKDGILNMEKGLYYGLDGRGARMAMPISEAVERGFVIAADVSDSAMTPGGGFVHEMKTFQLRSVLHPSTMKQMSVVDAIKEGIVDEHNGFYFNIATGEKYTIPEAIEKGLIDAELVSVTSDTEGDGSKIITTKLTTLNVTWVVDPRTGETISITKAIEQGIIDQNRGLYINPATGQTFSINDAIDKKLVIAQSSTSKSSSNRSSISSIHITEEQESFEANVVEDIHSETVTLSISSVIDPRTMEMITYDDAVLYGIVNLADGVYRNPVTREAMPINTAIEKGLIHGQVTSKVREEDLLKSSVSAQIHLFPVRNITSVLDPRTGEEISADIAIKEGIINADKGTFFDSRSRETISLENALKQGFINLSKASDEADLLKVHEEKVHLPPQGPVEDVRPSYVDMKMEKTGMTSESDNQRQSVADEVLNYSTEVEELASYPKDGDCTPKTPSVFVGLDENVTVEKALQAFGIKSESKSSSQSEMEPEAKETPEPLHLSYDQIVRLGLLDKTRGKIRDPRTGRLMNMNEAIREGLLDPDQVALVDLSTGDILTLRDCFRKGIVDPSTGKINDKQANAQNLALSPHHTSRLPHVKPLNLLDAVEAGLFDDETCKFMDPTNGQIWNLKDAVANTVIDGNLVTVENPGTHSKAVLKSALRQGFIEGNTAFVVNSVTGEKIPLCDAIKRGLVQHAYQLDSGTLFDPQTGEVVTLEKALTSGQLRSSEGCVIDTKTGEKVPLDMAFKRGMLDRQTGSVLDKKTGKTMSAQDAVKLGLLAVVGAPVLAGKAVYDAVSSRLSQKSPAMTINGDMQKTVAETARPSMTIVYAKPEDRIRPSKPRQSESYDGSVTNNGDMMYTVSGRMVESYDKLVQDLHNQMNWISDIEQLLKDDLPISDEAFKVQSQLQTQKGLHGDIQKHQQPILSLVYQGEQLVEHQQEELTPEQVIELQNLTASLKATFNKVLKTSDSRLKHLGLASEELTKFEEEQKKFETWITDTIRELSMQEDTVKDLDFLKRITDQHKELSNNIISHQADLRFLSMAVSKYMEEVKLHKLELDAYKADRKKSNRLSWLGMEGMEAEVVRDKLRDTTSRYQDLRDRCNAFGEKLGTLNSKQKDFNDNTWKMLSWLTETEEKLSAYKHELSASEPDAFHQHLDKMKELSSDTISHGVQLEELQKSGKELSEAFREMGVEPNHVQKMEEIIEDIVVRHSSVTGEINDRTKGLQASLTKSQDIHAAMENLLTWLKDTEKTLTNQRPISLNRENLNDQVQAMKMLVNDIESHKQSMDSVKQAANELMKTCDLDMAKSLEGKLGDMECRFLTAQSQCHGRTKDLYEISDALSHFQDSAEHCNEWLQAKIELLESKDWVRMDGQELKNKVDAISDESNASLPIDETKTVGQTLIEDERTGDVGSVKESMHNLDRNFHEFKGLLSQREDEASMKTKQGHEYEVAKKGVVEWLTTMEGTVDGFEPVAVDIEIVETQVEELQPLLQDYEDFVVRIDDINDLGNNFDALQNPERPSSPLRRMLRTHRLSGGSPRLRSPSPTFLFPSSPTTALSPSSESSGVSSRKSSSDNLLLEDLTETQQEIVDMNQRYEILGERLADRQQELQHMLDNVKVFLQDLEDLLKWLDLKEREVDIVGPIPTNEREAKKRLKEHELFHQELLQKEGLVEEIRKKAQELVKAKSGQPGIDAVRQQSVELEEKWLGTKVSSEQRRKLLENMVNDLRSFKESGLHLQKWVAQKVKMIDALGPITTESSMIQFQMKQVKVLEEEVHTEEPTYEVFLQSAHSILDKCEADARDAEHISLKMKDISKGWDQLQTRLRDRSNSLSSVEGLGTEFNDTMKDLQDSVMELNAKVENLGPVSVHPQKHKFQLEEVEELQSEVNSQKPALVKCQDLCKKLTDITKDSSTKFELRNKLSNVEKPIKELDNSLATRKRELEDASEQGKKFHLSCQDLLSWLDDSKEKLSCMEPLSGHLDVLKDQAQEHKMVLKDMDDHYPEVSAVLNKGQEMVDGASATPESMELVSKIDEVQSKWDDLKNETDRRTKQLEASTKHGEQFQDHLDKMLLWLQMSEDKLKGLSVASLDGDSVAKKLKDARGLQRDILKMSHDHEILNKEGEALLDSVDCNKDHVSKQMDGINTRWDDLSESVGTKVQDLDDMSQRLSEYTDNLADMKANLDNLEDKLHLHTSLGETAKDPKNLDKMKTLQDDIGHLQSPMNYIQALVDGFNYGPEGSNATEGLAADLDKLRQRRDDLQHKVGNIVDEMEAGSQHLDKFEDKMKVCGAQLQDLENEYNRFSPVARDENALATQIRENEELLSHLTDVEDKLNDADESYRDVISHGYLTDPRVAQSQLDSLKKQFEKLKEKGNKRKEELGETSEKVDQVMDNMRRIQTSLDRAADELEMHEPVGTDVAQIKEQQKELKDYLQLVLDPLQHRVEKVASEAQDLLQTASPGVNTSCLESDLEVLTDKSAALNEKVSERDRNLDTALLKTGKFNDAFESLIAWLKETEEMVANQKPPSPDFKVCKAQLQEQKFLQKMLEDRAPGVMSVQESAADLKKTLDQREQKRIQNQISQLEQRWEALTTSAGERMKTLDQMIGLAKDFQEMQNPLVHWLDVVEKKFASLEPSVMDTDGVENIIIALKDIQSDLNKREQPVKALAMKAKQLQDFCKGDDVKNIQKKIDDVQSRFSSLRDKLTDTLEQMEEALPLVRSFNDAHGKFLNWIAKVEPELKSQQSTGAESGEDVQRLVEKLEEIQPILEIVNSEGSQLTDLAPGDAGLKIEDTINKDNKQFKSINEQVQNKANKLRVSKQKSSEICGDLENVLDWFSQAKGRLQQDASLSSDPTRLLEQVGEQKELNDDIQNQRSKARDLIAVGRRLLREGSVESENDLQSKMDDLKQLSDDVAKMGADKLSHLEKAMPQAKLFAATHEELNTWLDEVEPSLMELEVMSINEEQVKKQQDHLKVLKQDIQDHKPVCDKLNKTGSSLIQLCGEADGAMVQDTMDRDNKRIAHIHSGVKERSECIDEALQQSADFTDKLENMIENLEMTKGHVDNAEPISAHPDKLREQLADNKAIVEDLAMRKSALDSVRATAEDLIKQAKDEQDDAVKDVKRKLDDLVQHYNKIKAETQGRSRKLEDTLEVSEKFWEDLHTLLGTLKDLQDSITSQEPPALEPAIIREQQETLEALKEEMDSAQYDAKDIQATGDLLVNMCGEPDRPEVQKNIDDLGTNLIAVNEEYQKRSKSLEDALSKAVQFQDELMKTLVWLQRHEEKLKEMPPVAKDFDTIKKQWTELKFFKEGVEPKQMEIEALNQQANELVRDTTEEQAAVVIEPMTTVNLKWDALMDGIGQRERMLQLGMLEIGQFEHAINQILAWLDKTDQTLDEGKPIFGDVRQIEMELSKHKALQNDISGHKESVNSLKNAGKQVISGGDLEAASAPRKLEDMMRLWDVVLTKSNDRQGQLEDALREAKDFGEGLQKMLMHLSEIDGQLISSKPIGGLPETAKDQLNKFLSLHTDLENLESQYERILLDGDNLLTKCSEPAVGNITQKQDLLKNRWETINSRARDRKDKLEEAVSQASNFHDNLSEFIAWLTDTERRLNNLQPVSRVLDRVTPQIEDHRVLQRDITKNRDAMIALDKTGTHLKYFSQKPDVVVIKNMLGSIHQRWEKIVSRSAERTRHLERGYKEAKQFSDKWKELLDWLVEAEVNLDLDMHVNSDPAKIKVQIKKHKVFQRSLGAKQPAYDGVNRTGRSLKDRCTADDIPHIQQMLNELRNQWNQLCGRSVDRQRKLEEALLFSGQFSEALQALLDWLAKVEPTLGEDQPVHGDIDTVNNLMEAHKAFQQELGARANTIQFVQKRARELIDKSDEDTSQHQAQLIELSTLWDRVCKLSVNKQERMEQAHKLADDFHKKANELLNWLAGAERQLRYHGVLADDEEGMLKQIEDHKKFEEELLREERVLRETLNIGQDIMKRCHPDAVSTLKHWLSVLRARWEEVTNWSRQRARKMAEQLALMSRNNKLLEELLAWINGAETRLSLADREPIPQDIEQIKQLIGEHQEFQNEMTNKQPDVDNVTRAEKRRTASTSAEPGSHIPILATLSGRRTPVKRTPSKFADSPGRRTPEPHFKNPRVGALFNKWRHTWFNAMERQRKLQDALDHWNEVEKLKDFKFDDWRRRYLKWMNHNKSRIMDFFRRKDRDHDGRITRKEFIEGILQSRFPTSDLEMQTVANVFDRDGDGFIDYKEFVSALRPDRQPVKPETDSEMIQDEVSRQVSKCTCVKQFKIHKIGEGKYRFGDSQKLRLVRILRSTVMVRVGGGWVALDEFLVKNDPCRAKGRTNLELREQFILAEGVSQSMSGFTSRSPSGSSYSGSSTYSGAGSWGAHSPSSASGPITKIREKTQYPSPWRQRVKTSPDGEVRQIMSRRESDGTRTTKTKVTHDLRSPHDHSASPVTPSRSSSRASTSSQISETSEPEVYTTLQSETRKVGGRNQTTLTYQTHVVETRTVRTPTSTSSSRTSKIPKPSPRK